MAPEAGSRPLVRGMSRVPAACCLSESRAISKSSSSCPAARGQGDKDVPTVTSRMRVVCSAGMRSHCSLCCWLSILGAQKATRHCVCLAADPVRQRQHCTKCHGTSGAGGRAACSVSCTSKSSSEASACSSCFGSGWASAAAVKGAPMVDHAVSTNAMNPSASS